jgi:hypothetical protein
VSETSHSAWIATNRPIVTWDLFVPSVPSKTSKTPVITLFTLFETRHEPPPRERSRAYPVLETNRSTWIATSRPIVTWDLFVPSIPSKTSKNPRNNTFYAMKQHPRHQKTWNPFPASTTDSFSPQWAEGPRMTRGHTHRAYFPPFALKKAETPEISLLSFCHIESDYFPPWDRHKLLSSHGLR